MLQLVLTLPLQTYKPFSRQASIGATFPKYSQGLRNHVDTIPWITACCLQSPFANVVKPNTYKNPEQKTYRCPFYRWINWGSERLMITPEDTQMLSRKWATRLDSLISNSAFLWLLIINKADVTRSLSLIKLWLKSQNLHYILCCSMYLEW